MTDWTTTAARPDPARLRLETYPVVDTAQARYGDMDANAHMNNLALESLHENARASMNRALLPAAYDTGTRRPRLVTSQNTVHFLAETHWPATFQTGAGVGRIGRTSYVASTGLFLEGRCIGVARHRSGAAERTGSGTNLRRVPCRAGDCPADRT